MKKSKYNYLMDKQGQSIIYNVYSDQLGILDTRLRALYEGNDAEGIRSKHPDFYDFLVKKGFLVDDELDEVARQIADWEAEDTSPRSFSITLNPTLNCNMRCWYCYEEHKTTANIVTKTVAAIERLVDAKLKKPSLEHINFSFFWWRTSFDGAQCGSSAGYEHQCKVL